MVVLAAVALATSRSAPVAPTDSRIHFIGRFDRRDSAGPRCAWPGSAFEVRVRGGISVRLDEKGNDRWQVVEDGAPAQILVLKDGSNTFSFPLQGAHTLRFVKRTEAFVGTTQLAGVTLDQGAALLSPPRVGRRIEVIGDSITCGYGNEGKDRNEHFSPDTENAYLTYGWIAAEAVHADPTIVAWSGKKMWPDNTMPELYDRILPSDPTSVWSFDAPAPQAVVINLSTNDWGRGAPDEKGWTEAYAGFIGRLRTHYPKAVVYCTTSPMSGGTSWTTIRDYLQKVIALREAAGDHRVHLLEFPPQKAEDGIGSDWHPSVATHRIMAGILTAALRRDLRW